MKAIDRHVLTIDAPAERVFAFITDPRTASLRMPVVVHDHYEARERLQAGDIRESCYTLLGFHWTERRWVVWINPAAMRVMWQGNSALTTAEEWRVEPLESDRCRLVVERELGEVRSLWVALLRTFLEPLMRRLIVSRMEMVRRAVVSGWRQEPVAA